MKLGCAWGNRGCHGARKDKAEFEKETELPDASASAPLTIRTTFVMRPLFMTHITFTAEATGADFRML
jgi:hypothetical protein